MTLRVTLIQGGGSGLDQVPAVKEILAAAGVSVEWDEHLAGWAAVEKAGLPISDALLDSVRERKVALKTKLLRQPGVEVVGKKSAGNYNVQLRKALGLFATVRRLKNLPGLKARFSDVDLIVIREITEDLYSAIEHEIVPGVVQSIKVVTRDATERFLRFAFAFAREQGRKQIVCVHKANILKQSDGLFLGAFQRISEENKAHLQCRDLIIDNCCMQMVSRPHQFDVLVMGNLYGDMVSDLGAGIVGGISATRGINVGESIRVYESFHGAGRDVVPEGAANPLPLLLPACDMLEAHGHADAAGRVHAAIGRVLTEKEALTFDLGGKGTTAEMARAIVRAMG
ncbi:MAG: isocitrate/isopropylmalate family dehydrogenase [Gemmataceae bacterium]